MKLQTNAFIHNFSSPKGLNTARRKFETYLLAMRGLGVDTVAPVEWTLAAFMTEQVESNMLRCWTGAQCAMAHGCLSWADLQATKNLKLTKDAVFGVTWRMNDKKTMCHGLR